ncbi:MAG: ferrous iron transport protein B [Phycisphaerae bacterium]|nr:ferrous iron transport protein B [Phycisphaerae bacterium]
MTANIKIALAGNPNSGKTTLFNALTGARQHVGNYPGVTVEKKEGVCRRQGVTMQIVDLPGTYSLTGYSVEELVARSFIIDERPDVVVDVIDSSNLERNLYLATQLIELNVPIVLAFNMSDVARHRGFVFDIPKLSQLLGVPIVSMVGSRNEGIDELLKMVTEAARSGETPGTCRIRYGSEVEDELARIEAHLDPQHDLVARYGKRWLALKLLENDKEITELHHSPEVLAAVQFSREHLAAVFGEDPEIIIAERRYGFISGACQEAVQSSTELRHDMSDKADAVLTHPILGLPIFVGLMYLVFQLTFTLGEYPMVWMEHFLAFSGESLSAWWPGDPGPLHSLVVDGIIGGVGGVMVFLPNILLLFLAIAFLEDTGYMARAAFIMDHIMHKIGLHGKSFIPMLIGFGCSVPAIMATRILENRRNRLTTIMVIPLISCGARFPIYMMIIPAFFPNHRGLMLASIYFVGILLAIVLARLLRVTLLKGETLPFVMELPPYRLPTVRGLLIHTWQRGWMYVRKAGTVILAISIVIWAATSYPKMDAAALQNMTPEQVSTAELQHSVVGRIGKTLAPALKPLGFDWRISTSLVGAFAAKEVFVSQLGIMYSVGEAEEGGSEALRAKLQADYTPLQGFCVMLFCLISMPCVATIVITRQETGSWRWALLQLLGLTALAYVITMAVYQVGRVFV